MTLPAAIAALYFSYDAARGLHTQIDLARQQADLQEDADAATRLRAALEVLYACEEAKPTTGPGQATAAPPPVARQACATPKHPPPLRVAALREFLALSYRQAVRREHRRNETAPRVELSDAERTPAARADVIDACLRFVAGRRGVARLPSVNLSGLRIERLLFCGVDLRRANVRNVHAEHALFVDANLAYTQWGGRFIEVAWVNANFLAATMEEAELVSSSFNDHHTPCPADLECFDRFVPETMQGVRAYSVVFQQRFYASQCDGCRILASRAAPPIYSMLECSVRGTGSSATYPCIVRPLTAADSPRGGAEVPAIWLD